MMHIREWLPQFFWRTKKKQSTRSVSSFLTPTNATGAGVANFDPVLISLIRRAMPNLVAYDLAGVQPMNGPTGLIFAMRSRYTNQTGTEALFDEETLSGFSGVGTNGTHSTNHYVTGSDGASDGFGKDQAGNNPGVLDPNDASATLLVKVWIPRLQKVLEKQVMLSRKWHSRSRKLPLLQSPEH